MCCSPRGLTPDWDMTERLNDNHKCQMLVWEKNGGREEEKEGRTERGREGERKKK